MTDSHEPAAAAERHSTPLVVKLLVAATFIVVLNETVLANALPRLMRDFGTDLRAAQWLTTAFLLTMAAIIPLTGWFLQRVSTRTAYALALGTFSAGTLIATLAPVFEVLLAARVVQAAGTAVMVPLLMTTIMTLVDSSDRGRVMGQLTLVTATAPALGPPLSGLVLQFGSWRLIFATTFVLAVAILMLSVRSMPNDGERTAPGVSWLSLLLGAVSLSTLLYGISRIGADRSLAPIVTIAIGLALVATFAWYQVRLQRTDSPLLDLRTLRYSTYATGVVVIALGTMSFFGSLILLPLYLQIVRGLDELQSGLMVAPGALAMGLLGPQIGKIFDRFGARPMVWIGSLGVIAALFAFSLIGVRTPLVIIIALHVVLMSCLAAFFTPTFTLSLGSLPAHLYSHGSSLLGAMQQVGGAIGTTILVVILELRSVALTASGSNRVDAFVGGMQWAFIVGALMSAVVFFVILRLPGRAQPAEAESPPEETLAQCPEYR